MPNLFSHYRFRNLVRRQKVEFDKTKLADTKLRRVLTSIDLLSYGVASTVGAGIFVVTGVVGKEQAGPALALCFIIAGFASLLSALCYSEFASRIPVSGSAYSFSYASLGELIGWIVGWNITLEYSVSSAAVARAWAGYFVKLIEIISNSNSTAPNWLNNYPIGSSSLISLSPLAAFLIIAISILAYFGIQGSAKTTLVITCINISAILFIILGGAFNVTVSNWSPFFPFGFEGVIQGAGKVFFSYIGFDSVSTLAGETRNPRHDIPFATVGTLGIATALYIGVSFVVTGMVPYYSLDVNAPLSYAFSQVGWKWAAILISFVSLTTLTATTLASILPQPRIFYQMSCDGLLFSLFSRLNRWQVPNYGVIISAIFACLLAFFLDLDQLTDMISIGTLLAFTLVCGGIVVLRFRSDSNDHCSLEETNPLVALDSQKFSRVKCLEPIVRHFASPSIVALLVTFYFCFSVLFAVVVKAQVPYWAFAPIVLAILIIYLILQTLRHQSLTGFFNCPLVPLVPLMGMFINLYLIIQLPTSALWRVGIWTGVGVLIYFGYGIRNSKLNHD